MTSTNHFLDWRVYTGRVRSDRLHDEVCPPWHRVSCRDVSWTRLHDEAQPVRPQHEEQDGRVLLC